MNFVTIVPYMPELILGTVTVALLFAGLFVKGKPEYFIGILLVVLAVFILIFYGSAIRTGDYRLINMENLLLAVVAAFSLVMMYAYTTYQVQQGYELPLFLMFATVGAGIAVGSRNFIGLYLGLELYSLSVYFLIVYDRVKAAAVEAAARYLIVGMLSSALVIFGISLIYGYSNTLAFPHLKMTDMTNPGQALGMVIVISGILIKMGAVPFHLWVASVYENTMSPILAVMSVLGKMSFFMVLFKFGMLGYYSGAFEAIAAASILIGAFASLYQTSLKKMVAYLTVMSTGYALIPVVVATEEAYSYLILYLIAYTFAMIGIIAVLCSYRTGNIFIENTGRLSGLANTHPVRASLLIVFILSLAGFPPLAGFFAKFHLFLNAIENGHYALVLVGILTGIVNFALAARLVKIMFFDDGKTDLSSVNLALKALLAVCIVAVCFFVFLIPYIMSFVRGVVI